MCGCSGERACIAGAERRALYPFVFAGLFLILSGVVFDAIHLRLDYILAYRKDAVLTLPRSYHVGILLVALGVVLMIFGAIVAGLRAQKRPGATGADGACG
jgi:uncharacterized membrane protein